VGYLITRDAAAAMVRLGVRLQQRWLAVQQ
jgi:hypothetical protein